MQSTSSSSLSLSAFTRFLQIKYLLVFGFVSGMVFISLFVPIFFTAIDNVKIWAWVLFGISLTCFTCYYLVLYFFWKSGNLKLALFKNTLVVILSTVLLIFLIELWGFLVIYEVWILSEKIVFFVAFPIAVVAMFIGVSLSTKFFFTWQKERFSTKKPANIK